MVDKYNQEEKYKEITPLLASIEAGNIDIFNLLLGIKNIDINHKCKFYYSLELESSVKYSALSYAIKKQNIEIVKLLLLNEKLENDSVIHYNYNEQNKSQEKYECITPLHLAIELGNCKLVNLLIKSNKFDINFPETTFMYCNDKYTMSCELEKSKMAPLFIAIKKQNIEIVEKLMTTENIDTNCFYEYEKNFVKYNNHKAWKINKVKNIDDCFHLGSREYIKFINSKKHNMPALNYAVVIGNMEIFNYLYYNKKIDASLENESLQQFYNTKLDNNIISNNENKQKLNAFYEAIEYERTDIICFLLQDEKIDVNYPIQSWSSPIKLKSDIDEIKKIEVEEDRINNILLISKELDKKNKVFPEEYEKIPSLDYSIVNGSNKAAKLLIASERIDINLKTISYRKENGYDETGIIKISLLYLAVHNDNLEIAELILSDKRLDKNTVDSFHYIKWYDSFVDVTPFHYSIEKGNIEMVKLFLKSGNFDINFQKSSLIERNKKIDDKIVITGKESEEFQCLNIIFNIFFSLAIFFFQIPKIVFGKCKLMFR